MIRVIDAGLTNSGPPSANVYRRLPSSSGLNSFVSIVVCLEKSSKLRGIVGLEPHNRSTHKRTMTLATPAFPRLPVQDICQTARPVHD